MPCTQGTFVFTFFFSPIVLLTTSRYHTNHQQFRNHSLKSIVLEATATSEKCWRGEYGESSHFPGKTKTKIRILLAKEVVSSCVPSPSCPNISVSLHKVKFLVHSLGTSWAPRVHSSWWILKALGFKEPSTLAVLAWGNQSPLLRWLHYVLQNIS